MNALEYEYTDYLKEYEDRPNDILIDKNGFRKRSDDVPMTERQFYILRRKYTFEQLLVLTRYAAAMAVSVINKMQGGLK